MKRTGFYVLAFMGASVAAINAAHLLPVSATYSYAWWKVAGGVLGFCYFAALGSRANGR